MNQIRKKKAQMRDISLECLNTLSSYIPLDEMTEEAKDIGLEYQEYLEMAYENMQSDVALAVSKINNLK